MAITTMDGVVNGLSVGRHTVFNSPSFTTASGGWTNSQRAAVTSFGQMAIPATAAAGGTLHGTSEVGFPNLPSPSGTRYLAKIAMTSAQAGALHVYDRVWSCSGFSGTVTSAQPVTGFPTLTRPDSNGTGLEIWIECYSATGGSTQANVAVQYTNSSGVSGRNTVSVTHISSMPANRLYPVILQSGDTGVRSIQSITISASTGSTGDLGVTLLKRIATIPLTSPNIPSALDFAACGMPIVLPNTAVNFIHQGTTTSSGTVLGSLVFIEG